MSDLSYSNISFPLSRNFKIFLSWLSCFIVALGQPAWSSGLSILASLVGYALFFRVLVDVKPPKQRFLVGTLWFALTQFIQLSWVFSHPFLYIYAFWIVWPLLLGVQFGCIAYLVNPRVLSSFSGVLLLSGLWALLEWMRFHILSGYSFNLTGMALTANLYSLQFASIGGILGLSFWVILVNGQLLRAWLNKSKRAWTLALALAIIPYVYGAVALNEHERTKQNTETLTALLVQTAFPVEVSVRQQKDIVAYVTNQWRKILEITKKAQGTKLDLIALPEYVVPFGTYTFVYPYEKVKIIFQETFGKEALALLPKIDFHLGVEEWTPQGSQILVNNAYWLQGIANVYNSPVVAGLADVEGISSEERKHFSAALFFVPGIQPHLPERYEKRVLVPLGEYIPFEFCRKLAASYGIQGSFTCGTEAKVFTHPEIPFGASICYEETFGNLMRDNRLKGAQMLVNLTNDAWFPESRLAKQHLDHARLRTVENGIPLLRSCNTGKTAAIDSLGRIHCILGEGDPNQESISDSLLVTLPRYHYHTIYSRFGDLLVVCLSFFCVGLYSFQSRRT